MTIFSLKKCQISRPQFHRPGFSDFSLFNVIKCPIRPFRRKKNHYFKKEFLNKTSFYTLFILSHTSDNTTSLNIGGTNAWAVPHLKFFGGIVPHSPPGLRPWRKSVSELLPPTCNTPVLLLL